MLRKYQKVEEAELVSKEGHEAIEDELRKTGKASMRDMTENERREVTDRLDSKS